MHDIALHIIKTFTGMALQIRHHYTELWFTNY